MVKLEEVLEEDSPSQPSTGVVEDDADRDSARYSKYRRVSKANERLKVHLCETCGKSYTRAEHLRRHQQNHNEEICHCDWPGCDKTFHRTDLLQRHRERHADPSQQDDDETRRFSVASISNYTGAGAPTGLHDVSHASSHFTDYRWTPPPEYASDAMLGYPSQPKSVSVRSSSTASTRPSYWRNSDLDALSEKTASTRLSSWSLPSRVTSWMNAPYGTESKRGIPAHSIQQPATPEGIRQLTSELDEAGQETINVELISSIRHFVKKELTSPEDLETLFTVSGSADKAFAATCKQYISRYWGRLGEQVLGNFIASLKADEVVGSREQASTLALYGRIREDRVQVSATGAGGELRALLEILTWLGCVCRSPEEGQFLSSRAAITKNDMSKRKSHGKKYTIDLLDLVPVSNAQGSCWHNMFEGFILADGFKIPPRKHELGVELPFDMMRLLALVSYPMSCGEVVIMKGDGTALIPVSHNAAGSTQWHFLDNLGLDDLQTWSAIEKSTSGLPQSGSLGSLAKRRAFVGYFPKAEIHLGTKDSGFERIQISGAECDDRKEVILEHEVTPQIGGSAMGFSAQVSGKVTLYRAANHRLRGAHNRIHDKLRNAKDMPLLLFDVGTKRGWLVPEICVILHLALAWASLQSSPEYVLTKMPFAELQHDGGRASHQAILSAAKDLLPDHIPAEDDPYEPQNVIGIMTSILNRLSQIKDERMRLHVRGVKETKELIGYEFVDIAGFEEYMHAKRVGIGKNGAGWMQFVAKRPEMAVLVCSNLKDPVKLASGALGCAAWTEVPKDHFYLAATMPCLKYLSRRCGGEDSLKLYNDLYCTPPVGGVHSKSCKKSAWPCCAPLFQISDRPSKQSLRLDDFSTLVIGKTPSEKRRMPMSGSFRLHISASRDAHDQDENTPSDARSQKRLSSDSCQTPSTTDANTRMKLPLSPAEQASGASGSGLARPRVAGSESVRRSRVISLPHLSNEQRQWLKHTAG